MTYSANGPTERELRLVGAVAGKRVLDLGCGTGLASIAFAKQGGVVIAVDGSRERLDRGRARAEAEEVKVEFREGDLADLAFLRADSIDVVFSADAMGEVDDVARVFRQVQRVLRPHAAFVFSYEHPMARCVGPDGVLARSYFDPGPAVAERGGQAVQLYTRPLGEVFTELGRAGLRADTLLEPRPEGPGARLPATVVWRARKEGV
jgi:ubiquinone/menaquinone biosynthesis C-methylase UbiE